MTFILAIILMIQSISLGWSIVVGQRRNIEALALQAVFSLYLVVIAVRSVTQPTVDLHSESVWHLFTLSTLASAFFVSGEVLSLPPVAVAESLQLL